MLSTTIRSTLPTALAASALCLAASLASAAPTLVSASRGVQVGDLASGVDNGPNSPSSAGSAFDDVVTALRGGIPGVREPVQVSASQQSDIDLASGVVTGSGTAKVDFSAGAGTGAFAYTWLDVVFDLDGTYAYDISGLLQANRDGGMAMSSVVLEQDGGGLVFSHQATQGDTNVADSGALGAGRYHLWSFAVMNDGQGQTGFGGSGSFGFSMDLTPRGTVPEPATLSLLALAMLPLVRRGGRRRPA